MNGPRRGRRGRLLPAEPIITLIDRWLEEQGQSQWASDVAADRRNGRTVRLSPQERLAHAVGMPSGSLNRRLWRLRYEAQFVSHSIADELVTATYGPDAWHSEPELSGLLPRVRVRRDDDELLTDEEIQRWAARYRASLTPQEWREMCQAFSWMTLDDTLTVAA